MTENKRFEQDEESRMFAEEQIANDKLQQRIRELETRCEELAGAVRSAHEAAGIALNNYDAMEDRAEAVERKFAALREDAEKLRLALIAAREYDAHSLDCKIMSCIECANLRFWKTALRIEGLDTAFVANAQAKIARKWYD